jgi:UDP:flavonoid glycosyltransferase YjiC (YdhE family)
MFTTPPLLRYMTAEPFEYARSDWPASVRLIGPCPWDPPAEAPAWLEQVDRPIVLVSASSEFQDDGRLVRTALEALAGEDVQVVATLPSTEQPGRVPANARVEPFLPTPRSWSVLRARSPTAEPGVTQKALAAGVPVCVVPFGRDQLEVARRVEVAAAGTRLPRADAFRDARQRQPRVALAPLRPRPAGETAPWNLRHVAKDPLDRRSYGAGVP